MNLLCWDLDDKTHWGMTVGSESAFPDLCAKVLMRISIS